MKLTRGATFGILDDRSFYFTATCSRDAAILARGHEGRAVPHTDCINPLALRPWLGDLTVLHAERDGLRFFISLVGTRIADYVGKRRTGISVSDCVSDPEGSFALKVLETCLDERRPTFAQLPPRSIDAIHNWIDVLVLPFSEDGTTTDRLLVWMAPTPEGEHPSTTERVGFWGRLGFGAPKEVLPSVQVIHA